MKTLLFSVLAILGCALPGLSSAGDTSPIALVRTLPDAYVPGRIMTVSLEGSQWIDSLELYADVYETIPRGWRVVDSDRRLVGFDEATGTAHWQITIQPGVWIEEPWPFSMWYDVVPAPDSNGEVSFVGEWSYALRNSGARLRVATSGDASISGRVPLMRCVPQDYSTIQAAIDESLFGDTILVSAKAAAYVENLQMKQGVDLVGASNLSLPQVMGPIKMRPLTRLYRIHIASAGVGIYADRGVDICECLLTEISSAAIAYPGRGSSVRRCTIMGVGGGWDPAGIRAGRDMEVSNSLITGVEGTAIEFGTKDMKARITNCTIVANQVGIGAPYNNPGILVSNCVFRDNGFPDEPIPYDVIGAHVSYCCLHDGVHMGSGEQNIYADPMFVNAEAGNYRLLPNSPCIDAGDNGAVQADETDILGKPRIMFGGKTETVDMGAYEYWFIWASPRPDSSDIEVSWASAAGKAYSVFRSADLVTWQLANDDVVASDNITLWLDPIGSLTEAPMRFYRVTENE